MLTPPASTAASIDGVFPPGTDVDGFRISRLLAEGAMGQVYLAQDLTLGRRVALKFVRQELLGAGVTERFLNEARTTATFSHPNIVTVHAAGTYQKLPYLALEYLDGETLRDRMGRGALPQAEALRVCRAIAEAIAEAHRRGVIHADLKPENVLIPSDGRVRVVDFGLARVVGAHASATSGTPAYMAPERWRGTPPAPAIDVWALGVMLYELLVGHRPVDEPELARLAFAAATGALPLRAVPPVCSELVSACLALDPEARPTAEAIAAALTRILEGGGPTEDRSPYRGLRAFTEADAADFFGRDAEIDAFVERLRQESLLPLVGPSGIGKSSFLQAGVVPRLRQLETWTVLSLRPGPEPIRRLAVALAAAGAGRSAEELTDSLAHRPGEILRALERCTAAGTRVLLAIDAFEEAFTLARPQEALQFATCLRTAADGAMGWRVVVALRDDYLGQYARLEPMRASLGAAFVLGPLTPASLAMAITQPLRRVGYELDDPALVGRIVQDVEAQRAGLPLLQFACSALWERRDVGARRLLASMYDAMGGVGGALATHAQQVLRQLVADQVRVARALLLRLLTAEGTRRPRPQPELLEGLGEAAPKVLDRLLANRLLVATRDPQTDEATIELAHESLASTWPELARWVDETREQRALVQQLEQASELWEQRGRRDEETWGPEALQQALHRVQQWNVALPSRSSAFLEAAQRRAQRRTRRQRLGYTAAFLALFAIAAVSITAALAFREKQLEAIRQQEQIRLAAADVGLFDLILEAFDFDPATQTWSPASPLGLDWTLAAARADDGARTPYAPPELRRHGARLDEQGRLVETVEAPSREAYLTVQRQGCSPSEIHLRRLPGFASRGRTPRDRLVIPIPTCQASASVMVAIPAGPYLRPGDEEGDPPSVVEIPAYAMDRTEVTNAQFSLFEEWVMELGGDDRAIPPDHEVFRNARDANVPVSGVDALVAEAFCRYMGKALPGLDQWNKAFRGGLTLDAAGKVPNPAPARMEVWDNGTRLVAARGKALANLEWTDPFPTMAPVGSFPEDRSPYGIMDMAGNAKEWLASSAPSGPYRGLRRVGGGSWGSPPALGQHRAGWLNHHSARYFDYGQGFRCVTAQGP